MGRVTSIKALSPSNATIAKSSFGYDNWDNEIYSNDTTGQQTWASFAGANSTYLNKYAGGSGFTNTTDFYKNAGLSSNIHNLLVGIADYQNGTSSAKQETYLEYNSASKIIQAKEMVNGKAILLNTTYDQYGNVLSSTNALGYTIYNQYSATYSHAYLTQSSILVGGQNVSTTYTYNSTTGWMTSETDPNGQTTFYYYDNLGRQTVVTYPMVGTQEAQQKYTYNDTANTVTSTDPNGHVIKQYYDGLDRLIKVVRYNGSSPYSTVSYTYNWLDEVNSTSNADGNKTSYSYDLYGRMIKAVNTDTTYKTTSYNDTTNVQTMIDENGHKTQIGYDTNNELIWVKQYNATSTYYQTSYTYDQSGNLQNITDANKEVTSYKYDYLNRLVSTRYPDGTSETMSYDNNGNVVNMTNPSGQTTKYTYDALNRLTTVKYADGSNVSYTYDKDGNVLSMFYGGSKDYYRYDARDRLTNETDIIDGASYTILYSYDADSNIVKMTYPDGYNFSYGYDPINRLSSAGSFANMTYTINNEISAISFANGVKTTLSYNSRQWPLRILSSHGATKYLDLNYTYDAVGNIRSIDTQTYSYHWLNQLSSSVGPWGTLNYTYDGSGNILSARQGGVTTAYTYGSFNRLTQIGSSVSLYYNTNGDTNKKVNGSNTWRNYYDLVDRLTGVSKNGNTVQNNSYAGNGNRITQTLSGSTLVYLYEGLNIIYMKNLTSGVITKNFFANGLQIAQLSGTGSPDYVGVDHLESIRFVTDASGNLILSSNYLPYGVAYGASGFTTLMYAGKAFDSSTGLYYFNARFYDPTIQRFLTEDPTGGSMLNPLSLNQYAYAGDNPIGNTDPSGRVVFYAGGSGWYYPYAYRCYGNGCGGASSTSTSVSGTSTSVSTTSTSGTGSQQSSGSGIGSAQSSQSYLSERDWFLQVWITSFANFVSLVLLGVSVALGALGMTWLAKRLAKWIDGEVSAAQIKLTQKTITGSSSIGGFEIDIGNVTSDLHRGNTVGFVTDLLSMGLDLFWAFLNTADWWTKAAVGAQLVADGIVDGASAGAFSTLVFILSTAWSVSSFLIGVQNDYNQYVSSFQ